MIYILLNASPVKEVATISNVSYTSAWNFGHFVLNHYRILFQTTLGDYFSYVQRLVIAIIHFLSSMYSKTMLTVWCV